MIRNGIKSANQVQFQNQDGEPMVPVTDNNGNMNVNVKGGVPTYPTTQDGVVKTYVVNGEAGAEVKTLYCAFTSINTDAFIDIEIPAHKKITNITFVTTSGDGVIGNINGKTVSGLANAVTDIELNDTLTTLSFKLIDNKAVSGAEVGVGNVQVCIEGIVEEG